MKPRPKKIKGKLYEQWIRHSDLPRRVVPQEERPRKERHRDVPADREKSAQRVRGLYILVAVIILIFIFLVTLVFLLYQYY